MEEAQTSPNGMLKCPVRGNDFRGLRLMYFRPSVRRFPLDGELRRQRRSRRGRLRWACFLEVKLASNIKEICCISSGFSKNSCSQAHAAFFATFWRPSHIIVYNLRNIVKSKLDYLLVCFSYFLLVTFHTTLLVVPFKGVPFIEYSVCVRTTVQNGIPPPTKCLVDFVNFQ